MAGPKCLWPACDAICESAEALYKHLVEVHAVRNDGEKTLACKWPTSSGTCKTQPRFTNAGNCGVKRHLQTHTDWWPVSCPSCPTKFRDKIGLREHQRTVQHHHESEDEAEDDDSEDLSDDSSAVVLVGHPHRVRPSSAVPAPPSGTNGGTTSCQWDYCNTRFRDADALYAHICDAHIKSAPGPCLWTQCAYTDPMANNNLRRHVKAQHAHDGSYTCVHCNSVFGTDTQLKKHKRAAHPDRSRRASPAPPPAQKQSAKRKAGSLDRREVKKARVDHGPAASKPAATSGSVVAPANGSVVSGTTGAATLNPNALLAHVAAQWEQQVAEHLTGIAINVANRMSGALGQAPGSLPPPT